MNVRSLVEAEAARRFPGDPDSQRWFTALAQQESGFNPNAVPPGNPANVYGVFQFGPELRRQYGLTPNSSPEAQVAAAGDYLAGLHKKWGGDWTKVLAEHYLGLPRLTRWQAGTPDAETNSFTTAHLPAVARRYAALGGTPMLIPPPWTAPVAAGGNTPLPGLGGGPMPGTELPNYGAAPGQVQAGPDLSGVDPEELKRLILALSQLAAQQGGGPLGAVGAGSAGGPAMLRALMGLQQNTGPIVDPIAQRQQMYPTAQSGPYLQWLGGSLQPQEPNARILATAGLLNNLLTGWQEGRQRAAQGEGTPNG